MAGHGRSASAERPLPVPGPHRYGCGPAFDRGSYRSRQEIAIVEQALETAGSSSILSGLSAMPESLKAAVIIGANRSILGHAGFALDRLHHPVLLVAGECDPINPYQGRKTTLFGLGYRGNVLSAEDSAAELAWLALSRHPSEWVSGRMTASRNHDRHDRLLQRRRGLCAASEAAQRRPHDPAVLRRDAANAGRYGRRHRHSALRLAIFPPRFACADY